MRRAGNPRISNLERPHRRISNGCDRRPGTSFRPIQRARRTSGANGLPAPEPDLGIVAGWRSRRFFGLRRAFRRSPPARSGLARLGARDPCSNTHVKPLRAETLYSTPWFDLVAKTMRPGEAPYYSLRLPDYVGILALTEDRRVILVRQYRPAVEEFTVELPAGLVDPGESPVDAARRELLEETGYVAPEIKTIGEMSTDTGRLSNRIWACYAPGVRRAPDCRTETGIETLAYSTGELMEMTKAGQFKQALHVAILTLAAARGLITIS
jgi:ADP-ribose pyrophosphatase